jgi:hypothetical protein
MDFSPINAKKNSDFHADKHQNPTIEEKGVFFKSTKLLKKDIYTLRQS